LKSLLAALALLLVLPIYSPACSLASCGSDGGTEMRRDFRVRITHRGVPLAGVTVHVSGNPAVEKTLFSGITGADGTVRVVNLPSGEYWLSADLLGISAAYECFHISSQTSRSAKQLVTYRWGDSAVQTREISGRLIDPMPGENAILLQNIRNGVVDPIVGATLKLQNARTAEVYDVTSDDDGRFSFGPITNGPYVLHVEGGTALGGRAYAPTDLLIRMNDRAALNTLLLKRTSGGGGSCGGSTLLLDTRATKN
jgi:hypothetical protein